ncbi:MAG TPA: hypothetical protein VFB92_21815 [Vicinamibacterales bacterium]|nr:hypothetical protein [Vicinamibacterales bacterium]
MALIRGATNSPPLLSRIRRQLTLDADAVHDAMHAVRMLVKAPAFTRDRSVRFRYRNWIDNGDGKHRRRLVSSRAAGVAARTGYDALAVQP